NSTAEEAFGIEATFRERHREAAFGAIVRASYETGADQIADSVLHREFALNVETWRQASLAAMTDFQETRCAKLIRVFTDEDYHIARGLEPLRRDMRLVIDQTNHRDRRRRVDDTGGTLII